MKSLNGYEVVIGLEIHVEVDTQTKLFCSCSREYGRDPNTQVCPVCLGYPGALPVLNEEVVIQGLKVARALRSRINEVSQFFRKNYFYPDLPKGYQITQYTFSLAEDGHLEYQFEGSPRRVRVERINIEEEAAKSFHTEDGYTLLDFNRSGIPLLEIVTRPDLRSPAEARTFLAKLRQLIRYLEVSPCDMEKGHLRADANLSVHRPGEPLGTKVEIKNLNSFKALEDALTYEAQRQIQVLEAGGKVVQETRLFDESTGQTVAMRTKEEEMDYRYFPEPDLLPLNVTAYLNRFELPELPWEKSARFVREYGLREDVAEVLTQERALADYFEEMVRDLKDIAQAANWLVNRVLADIKERSLEEFPIRPSQMAELLSLVESGRITLNLAKDVYERMLQEGRSARDIVESEGLEVVSAEEELQKYVAEAVEENPDLVAKFRKGKEGVIGPLIGAVMKKTRGKADPKRVRELLLKALRGGSGA